MLQWLREEHKHIPIAGGSDKRAITLTIVQSLTVLMLPYQVIYTGKTEEKCLPKNVGNNENKFLFSLNEKHWSNEFETLNLIDEITANSR